MTCLKVFTSTLSVVYTLFNLLIIYTILFSETNNEVLREKYANAHIEWFKIDGKTVGSILYRFTVLLPVAIVLLIKRILLIKIRIKKDS